MEWYNRLRYSPTKLYFNSGVILINLYYWRKHGVLKKFLGYISNCRDRIVSHDQDVLNVVFQDEKILLPLKYNLQEGFLLKKRRFYYWDYEDEFLSAIKNPAILHYTVFKPWQKICKHPRKYLFFEYVNQTIWKGFKLKKYPQKKSQKEKVKHAILFFLELIHLKKKPEYPYIDF